MMASTSPSSTYRIHWAAILLIFCLGLAGYWLWDQSISDMVDIQWNSDLEADDFPWWGEHQGISLTNLSSDFQDRESATKNHVLRQEARFQNYLETLPQQIEYQRAADSNATRIASLETLQWYLDFQLRAKPFLYHFFLLNSYTGNPWALNMDLELRYPIKTGEDAEIFVSQMPMYIERMKTITAYTDSQVAKGIIPHQSLIERSIQSLNEMAALEPAEHPLYQFLARSLVRLPSTEINENNAATLLMQMSIVLKNQLYPTYRQLGADLENLKTQAPLEGGAARFPDGVAYYQYCLEYYVGKEADTDVITRLAEREVKALDQILTQLSSPSDEIDQAETRIQVYEKTLRDMRNKTKGIFSQVPKRGPVLKSMPLFWPDRGHPSLYVPASQISTEKATTFIGLDTDQDMDRQISNARDITHAYAATIPGAHLPASYLPKDDLRHLLHLPAWQEGWALYAASLPVTDLRLLASRPDIYRGYLQMRIQHATRTLVDVKLHGAEWTRAEAIAYLTSMGRMSSEKAAYETDRILAHPAAACAPLIGELKFQEIRARIEEDLDRSIPLRDFHDWLLEIGPVPFDLLDRYTDEFIQSKLAS